MKLLENKVAVITGAARGIGEGIALKFAENGANIAFSYVSESSAEKARVLEEKLVALGVKAKAYRSNAGNFTEFGLLRDFLLPAGFSLRLGGFGRVIEHRLTHTEYALLNWSWGQSPWRGFCLRPTLLHRSESSCNQF